MHTNDARRDLLGRGLSRRDVARALTLATAGASLPFSNERSMAQATEHPEAWPRAIYAGDEPVGFLMLHDEHLRATPREQG